MLKTLRTRTRHVMLITLIMVIPSFIFYFGWQSIRGRHAETELAQQVRFRPPESFHKAVRGWGGWANLTETDLVMTRREMFQNLAKSYGEDFMQNVGREIEEEEMFPLKDVIDHSIDKWLMERLADRRKISITDDELTGMIESAFGDIPLELREQALRREGLTVPAFENLLRSEGRIERASQHIYAQSRPSHAQLWETYLVEREQMRVDYALFYATDYQDKVEVTDAQLETYLRENSEKFRVGDQRRYRYALLRKDTFRKETQVTPDEVRQYYEDRKQQDYKHDRQVRVRQILILQETTPDMSEQQHAELTTQTLIKAQLVHARALEAADFGRLADEFSGASGNTSGTLSGTPAKTGGLVEGWISAERTREFGQSFVKTALELRKDQISPPVTVRLRGEKPFTFKEGFSIIKCEEEREPGVWPFEEIASRVQKDCHESKAVRLFQEKDKELSREVFNYTTIEGLARDKGMEDGLTSWVLTTSPLLSRDIVMDRPDLDYINSDLRKGEISPLMRTEDEDTLFVLYLEDENPSHIPSDFREIRAQVESAYIAEKSMEKAKQGAEVFLAKLSPEDFVTTSSAVLENRVKTTGFFARMEHANQLPAPLVDFVQDTFLATTHTIGLSAVGPDKNNVIGYAVWHIREMKTPTREDFKKVLPIMERNAVFAQREGLLDEWLWDQRSMTTVEDTSSRKKK